MDAKRGPGGSRRPLRGVQTAIGREVGCQSGFGSHFGGMLPSFGSILGAAASAALANLEPKVVKTAIKNASEFKVDFEMHF